MLLSQTTIYTYEHFTGVCVSISSQIKLSLCNLFTLILLYYQNSGIRKLKANKTAPRRSQTSIRSCTTIVWETTKVQMYSALSGQTNRSG